MNNGSSFERLAAFRRLLGQQGFAGALVLTSDPHLCEYVPDHWRQCEALTGFTGSAGTLLVEENAAALATDSRYWEQARKELPEAIELIQATSTAFEELVDWFARKLPSGGTVAVDERTISYADALKLSSLFSARGLQFLTTSIDWREVWTDRPDAVGSPIAAMRRPCRSRREKLSALRARLTERGATSLFLASLDEIAWLTNMRGADVPNNPVFEAEMVVGADDAVLYADVRRFSNEDVEALSADGIVIRPSSALHADLREAARRGRIMTDPSSVTVESLVCINADDLLFESPSVVCVLKSQKTDAELDAIREAHLLDATALVEFYAELDERLRAGERLTEWDAASLLHEHREKMPGFIDESFTTIAAYGPNAAMPHYQPDPKHSAELRAGNLLLIDSGAHYDCGTTDVTRMTAVGEISEAMRADVTLATRAMLRLLNLRFPVGATGAQVDTAARMDLWREGIDFGHGTGHGVGYVLNVHEAPVTISPRAHKFKLAPGNVVSDEPGIYRPGEWGIRVENLMCVVPDKETNFGRFLRFEPLTFCPIDVRPMAKPFGDLVDELNAFNARCVKALEGRVSKRALCWLKKAAAVAS